MQSPWTLGQASPHGACHPGTPSAKAPTQPSHPVHSAPRPVCPATLKATLSNLVETTDLSHLASHIQAPLLVSGLICPLPGCPAPGHSAPRTAGAHSVPRPRPSGLAGIRSTWEGGACMAESGGDARSWSKPHQKSRPNRQHPGRRRDGAEVATRHLRTRRRPPYPSRPLTGRIRASIRASDETGRHARASRHRAGAHSGSKRAGAVRWAPCGAGPDA